MIENFKYTGFWWLPDNPSNKIAGEIRYIPGKFPELELIESFNPLQKDLLDQQIILGKLSNGREITLQECMHIKLSKTINRYHVKIAFIGAIFESQDKIIFNKVFILYSYLNEFIGISGFDKTNHRDKALHIVYKLPQGENICNVGIYKVDVIFNSKYSLLYPTCTHAEINQKAFIEISSEKAFQLNEIYDLIWHLQYFICLAINKPIFILSVSGWSPYYKKEVDGEIYYNDIDIILPITRIKKEDRSEMIRPLITFKQIKDRSNIIINNWINKRNKLKHVIDLYFDNIYEEHLSLPAMLLNMIQVLEVYHREYMNNCCIDEADHDQRIKDIMIKCPDKFNKWLKSKLEYSNRPTLRERLKDIIKKYKNTNMVFNNRATFINNVVNMRNYFIHYDNKGNPYIESNDKIYKMVYRLQFIVDNCLIDDLGFNKNEVRDLLFKDFFDRRGIFTKKDNG